MKEYSFRKFRPLSLRLWHWLNMIVILGLLATVLLRKTFLSWRSNSALIESKMQGIGHSVTPEFAKEIAVAIRNPLWDWHIYLGFALAGLILFRVLIALFVEKQCSCLDALKSLSGIKYLSGDKKVAAAHYSIVQLGYLIFYLVVLLMVITGFLQYFKGELGLSKDFVGIVKEIHELTMWFFVVFASGHIIGVVIAENRKEPGIVSDMIHGGKRE